MLRISAIALLAALGLASFNLRAEDAPAEGATPKRAHKEGAEGKKEEGRGSPVRERLQAMLFEGITLTDDQKAALEKLKEEGKKAAEAAHKDGEAKKEPPTKEERKAMMEKHTAAIRAILTADQAKIFDENVKKAEAKRAEMMKKVREGKGKDEGKGEGKPEAK